MNSLLCVNPEIEKKEKIVLWNCNGRSQELFVMLINQNINIDAFCIENYQFDTFMGKDVIGMLDLIEMDSYALLINVEDYETVISIYNKYGLKEENVYAYINPKYELIYI